MTTGHYPARPGHDEQNELVEQLTQRLTNVYSERNQCVAALAHLAQAYGFVVGIGDDLDGSEPEWRTVVYIETPRGQVSWHLHESEYELFKGLARARVAWDGHTTVQKYERLTGFCRVLAEAHAPSAGRRRFVESRRFVPELSAVDFFDSQGFTGPGFVYGDAELCVQIDRDGSFFALLVDREVRARHLHLIEDELFTHAREEKIL
jgi:hypothetical protein